MEKSFKEESFKVVGKNGKVALVRKDHGQYIALLNPSKTGKSYLNRKILKKSEWEVAKRCHDRQVAQGILDAQLEQN